MQYEVIEQHNRQLCNIYSTVTPLAIFASIEFISHVLAYLLAQYELEGSTISVFDIDAKLRDYQAFSLRTKHKGLTGYALIPKDFSLNRIHVVFCGVNDKYSIERAIDPEGPGQQSFNQSSGTIVKHIADYIDQTYGKIGKKIDVCISGHSLGGADAQNCTAALFAELVKDSTLVAKINSISVNHCNSAGIKIETAIKAKEDATYLSSLGIKIYSKVLKIDGDVIQQFGQTSILSGVPSEIAIVELFKKHTAINLNYMKAVTGNFTSYLISELQRNYQNHKSIIFTSPLEKNSYTILNNITERGLSIIKNELRNKTVMADNFLINPVRSLIFSALQYIFPAEETYISHKMGME